MTKAFEHPIDTDGQSALFDDVDFRHSYGDDDGGDFGHEFPFVRGIDTGSADSGVEQGVSVTLEERSLALKAIAGLYGRYNRGNGMKKAVAMPVHRQHIEPRYVDVDYVAERAKINGSYTYEQERATLQPLLKERQLVRAGFDEADVDLMAKTVMHDIRQQLGVDVRSGERQKNLRKIQ